MISRPGFDPVRVDEDWADLASRGDAPLLNRATQAVYQPGGALAPFLLAWADRVGVVQPNELAEDAGVPLSLDDLILTCRRAPESEAISYAEALDRGCPGPAATLAQELGGAHLGEMVGAFLLGRSPAVELPTAGAPTWAEPEGPEALVRFGVGQSDLLLSPLQVARAWSALARSGEIPGLRLVDAIQDSQGGWIRWTSVEGGRSALPPEVGHRLFAALPRGDHGEVGLQSTAVSGPRLETLAWYVAAWPADSPELVAVVVLEGGSVAVARQVGLAALGLETGTQP
jgi:cell division protein FtsI/penicillin-binding protein 2